MKTLLSSLLMQAALFTVTSVHSAEDRVIRTHSFDLAGIAEVEISGSVGEMDVVLVDGGELRLVLDIEGQDRGILRRAKDVSDVDLVSTVRGDRLVLRMDEDDTRTEWTIELPVVAVTRIELGVGEVRAEVGATDLEVDVGVGSAHVVSPTTETGRISLSSGVGEVRVSGATDVRSDRAFVSEDLRARGEGAHPLEVRVGVGEAVVNLE